MALAQLTGRVSAVLKHHPYSMLCELYITDSLIEDYLTDFHAHVSVFVFVTTDKCAT